MTSWPDHLPPGNQKRFWRIGNQIDAPMIFRAEDKASAKALFA